MTTIVSTRLNPSVIPSVPRTQLMGAMFAPIQIQNWSAVDDVRSSAGTGSTPCMSKLGGSPATAVEALAIIFSSGHSGMGWPVANCAGGLRSSR
jgi:hypothetical protein